MATVFKWSLNLSTWIHASRTIDKQKQTNPLHSMQTQNNPYPPLVMCTGHDITLINQVWNYPNEFIHQKQSIFKKQTNPSHNTTYINFSLYLYLPQHDNRLIQKTWIYHTSSPDTQHETKQILGKTKPAYGFNSNKLQPHKTLS
jgi:hypothetical protein